MQKHAQSSLLVQVAKRITQHSLHEYILKIVKVKSYCIQKNAANGNIKSNYAMVDNYMKYASTSIKSGSKVISMCIVPVEIKNGDNKKNGTHQCYVGQL